MQQFYSVILFSVSDDHQKLYIALPDSIFTGICNLFISIINPWRACAARVTVVVLCVCLSVCVSVCLSTTILTLQATRQLMSDTKSFSATRARKVMWRFCCNNCVREMWRKNKRKSQYA